ncbi:MAG: DMT family transporter [Pseudomonadota bacterium]
MSGTPQNIIGGVLLIVVTALTISLQDLVFKLFSGELTLWQIFALRGMMAVPLLILLGSLRQGLRPVLSLAYGFWPLMRGLCLTMTFLAFYAAIPFLSLSTVGAANYIAPVFVATLSAYVIKEPVSRLGWIGVVLGFAGVVVLLQPGTDAFSAFALLPVCGAAFYALGHIITRTRCQAVPTEALALSLNSLMCLAGVVASFALFVVVPIGLLAESSPYIFGQWSEVAGSDWLVLILLTGFAVAIGMMLAGAYKIAPPATVATFEYSYLIFVAAWDIVFFDTAPTALSLTGMAMIVGAGLLVMRGRPDKG